MMVTWNVFLRVYGPLIAFVVIALALGIYAAGHEAGKRDILYAAARAGAEGSGRE